MEHVDFASNLSEFRCSFSKPVSIFATYIFNFTEVIFFLIVGKERTSVQSLKTSRDASPSGSTALVSSKVNFLFEYFSPCFQIAEFFFFSWREILYAAVTGRSIQELLCRPAEDRLPLAGRKVLIILCF